MAASNNHGNGAGSQRMRRGVTAALGGSSVPPGEDVCAHARAGLLLVITIRVGLISFDGGHRMATVM